MGIKGAVEGGFPETKPAFALELHWGPTHNLGPTTHPKNNLAYGKFAGSIRTAPGSSLPPFEAEIVDSGAWAQQDHLPSGETWLRTDTTALLRVVEPSNASVDPVVAETETGYIRMKWSSVVQFSRFLESCLAGDGAEITRKLQREPNPHLVATFSFHTGDPRYKFLEHAVYVGKGRLGANPTEDVRQGSAEYKISSLAA